MHQTERIRPISTSPSEVMREVARDVAKKEWEKKKKLKYEK